MNARGDKNSAARSSTRYDPRPRIAAAYQLGQRLSKAAIHYSIHFSPTEVQRTFFVTLLVGAICGVVAVAFHGAIQTTSALLIDRAQDLNGPYWLPLTLLCPTLGGLLIGFALKYFPDAKGSGIPRIKATYAVQAGRLRLRDGVAKFCLTSLQVGSGASLGREGPTVQICSTVASTLGSWFALAPRSVRRLIPVGTAAGVAAAFNAPIAAVTFTVEEIVGGLDQTVLSGVVVAAALAAVIEHSILGENPVLTVTNPVGLQSASALVFYALLGLLAGLVSVVFSGSLLRLRARFSGARALPAWSKPAIGGLLTGICAVIGLLVVKMPGVAGGGYSQLSAAINGNLPLMALLVLGFLKFAATLFSYASGGVGGLFAPALFIGAMLGGSVGWLDRLVFDHAQYGQFALVGMGAAFAGIIRAPITSVLIIFEMTGGYGLVLPLMIANTTSYVVARRLNPRGLYDALLAQDGVQLLHGKAGSNQLAGLSVAPAMTSEVCTMDASLTAEEALREMAAHPFTAYPVNDHTGRCIGLINPARTKRVTAEGAGATPVSQLVRLKEYLLPDDPLTRAVVRMNALGTRQLPVVEAGTMRLLGILSMSDIFAAQAQAVANDAETDAPKAARLLESS